jgi:predicted porin
MRSMKGCLLFASFLLLAAPFSRAQSGESPGKGDAASSSGATKQEVDQLRKELAAQRQTIEQLKAMLQRLVETKAQPAEGARLVNANLDVTAQMQTPNQEKEQPQAATSKILRVPGNELKFSVGGGEVQIYGHADVSFDYVDNGLANRFGAVGNNGWLAQVSSNLSYFGVRGSRRLVPHLNGVFQIETEVAFSSTPGPTTDAQVKQGFGSRDTFVGLQGDWGAVKLGKEDAPYKRSTARMDPFINSIGDSRSIMGNSGGDNRSEFNGRLPHSLWYESPKFKGFYASVLFSPGQNRSTDNSILARVEPNCAGGNDAPCTDGAFGNVLSAVVSYTYGSLYAFTAYEHHAKANRTGDELASIADPSIPPAGSVGIADESAWRLGAQYEFKLTRTTANFVYEKLKRYAPAVPAFNERSRPNATWLAIVQKMTPNDDLNFGWAHAGKTPGDPGGQINQPGTVIGIAGPIDNRSNLIDVGYKHHFSDKRTSAYFVFASQMNHQGAHYDLGANGHGAVVDRADAAGNSFTGLTHKGLSVGLNYDF